MGPSMGYWVHEVLAFATAQYVKPLVKKFELSEKGIYETIEKLRQTGCIIVVY